MCSQPSTSVSRMRRFSKGMQKQAAFWLAHVHAGRTILVLDEPVDGLDPVMRKQVWSVILEDVAARGTTVLVSVSQSAGIGRRVRPCRRAA